MHSPVHVFPRPHSQRRLQHSFPQIKADLIRQREADLLVPAAGPNASEILRLLRPAASNPQEEETAVSLKAAGAAEPALWKPAAKASAPSSLAARLQRRRSISVAAAAAEAKKAADSAAAALLGLSCAISARGEVRLLHARFPDSFHLC
jgi:hypothetical protein